MKKLHELYQIVLDNKKLTWKENGITNQQYICNAIEYAFADNLISKDELLKIKGHFISQKPTRNLHDEFYLTSLWIGGGAWWDMMGIGTRGIEIRNEFLIKMIKITKEENI